MCEGINEKENIELVKKILEAGFHNLLIFLVVLTVCQASDPSINHQWLKFSGVCQTSWLAERRLTSSIRKRNLQIMKRIKTANKAKKKLSCQSNVWNKYCCKEHGLVHIQENQFLCCKEHVMVRFSENQFLCCNKSNLSLLLKFIFGRIGFVWLCFDILYKYTKFWSWNKRTHSIGSTSPN